MKEFKDSEAFDKKAARWSQKALVQAFRDMSKDIMDINSKFPLSALPYMQQFMVYEARVEAAKKRETKKEYDLWDDIESLELPPPRCSKHALEAETVPP